MRNEQRRDKSVRSIAAPPDHCADRPDHHLGSVDAGHPTGPVIKLGLHDFPPLTLVTLRYLAAVPWSLPVLLAGPLPVPRDLMLLAGLGACGVGLGQVSQAFGVRLTSASVATVVSAIA